MGDVKLMTACGSISNCSRHFYPDAFLYACRPLLPSCSAFEKGLFKDQDSHGTILRSCHDPDALL